MIKPLPLVSGEGNPHPLEFLFQLPEQSRVGFQVDAQDRGRGFQGAVVLGGPQAAAADNRVGLVEGQLQSGGQIGQVVAAGVMPSDNKAVVGQQGCGEGGIGVDDIPVEDLVPGTDQIHSHIANTLSRR